MTTILIILPYFGKLPKMFPYWLESCKLNPSIDFLILTDEYICEKATNIINIKISLLEIKERITRYLGFEVSLDRPYKLCDYKPLYGEIFKEYTSNYSFWGYCDCDLIFGDIRKFLTEDILKAYDYIGGMGHFHLQRCNDEKYNEVWKTAKATLAPNKTWEEVFQSSRNEYFDELPYGVSGRYYEMYPEKFYSGFFPTHCIFDDIDPLCNRHFIGIYNNYKRYKTHGLFLPFTNRLKFWKRIDSVYLNNVIYKKQGEKLYALGIVDGHISEREILYVHLQKRNFRYLTNSYSNFLIRPNTFFNNRKMDKIHLWMYPYYWDVNCQLISVKIRNRLKRYFGINISTLWE